LNAIAKEPQFTVACELVIDLCTCNHIPQSLSNAPHLKLGSLR